MGWVPPAPPPLPDDPITKVTVLYDIAIDASGKTITVSCPDELPEPGDILVFTADVPDFGWEQGDEVHLMDRTQDAPRGKVSSLGNWQVITKKGVDVWPNIEWLMADGVLKQL